MTRHLSVHTEEWAAAAPFRIANASWTSFPGVIVEISEGDLVGRGEGCGVFYLAETVASMTEQIRDVASAVEAGADRSELLGMLPPGGARHAIDSALWDLEAKRAGRRAWEIADVPLKPIVTVFTIGLEQEPAAMAAKAAAAIGHPRLKIKLDADRPVERIEGIRAARPDAALVIDANQSWDLELLKEAAPLMARLGVTMIEQPLPRGADGALEGYTPPLPLCADESCLHGGEVAEAARRYQMINIKLDKAGGLTHGLEMARAARGLGLGLMVGCMGGTSLAMAPSFVVGLLCDLHDLDGPLLLVNDRPHGLTYDRGAVSAPSPLLWG